MTGFIFTASMRFKSNCCSKAGSIFVSILRCRRCRLFYDYPVPCLSIKKCSRWWWAGLQQLTLNVVFCLVFLLSDKNVFLCFFKIATQQTWAPKISSNKTATEKVAKMLSIRCLCYHRRQRVFLFSFFLLKKWLDATAQLAKHSCCLFSFWTKNICCFFIHKKKSNCKKCLWRWCFFFFVLYQSQCEFLYWVQQTTRTSTIYRTKT